MGSFKDSTVCDSNQPACTVKASHFPLFTENTEQLFEPTIDQNCVRCYKFKNHRRENALWHLEKLELLSQFHRLANRDIIARIRKYSWQLSYQRIKKLNLRKTDYSLGDLLSATMSFYVQDISYM